MKRRIIVLSFMAVLFVLICAVASAESLQLDNAPAVVTWYTDLPQGGQSQNGPFSVYSTAEMQVPWNVKDYNDFNTVWNLDHVSGPDQFALDHYINKYSSGDAYFWASVKAKSSTLTDVDSVYTMKCTYKNKTYEGKVTIHAVSGVTLPTQLNLRAFKTDANGNTIGEEIPITDDVITVKAGDSFYLSGNANGSIPGINTESVFLNITYYDFEGYTIRNDRWLGAKDAQKGIYGNNTAMITALKLGNYRIEPWTGIANKTNFSVAHPITLQVTGDGTVDPYFPEPQISVNREYFADEEVNISLPWVTGAEYHEIRIFS